MNEKAAKFDQALLEKKIEWFQKLEQQDEFSSVFYRSKLAVHGEELPIFVVLDTTIFTVLRVVVGSKKFDKRKRGKIDAFFTELNSKFKIFKYYVSEEDQAVYLDISVPVQPGLFDSELILYIIGQILLPHLEEYYPQIKEKLGL